MLTTDCEVVFLFDAVVEFFTFEEVEFVDVFFTKSGTTVTLV